MDFARKLIISFAALSVAVLAGGCEEPIRRVARMFPAQGMVHCASFFYTQYSRNRALPEAESELLFTSQADTEALQVFLKPQSHASLHEYALGGSIVKLLRHIEQAVSQARKSKQKITTSLKFEFSRAGDAVVAVFEFSKTGNRLSVDVSLFGFSSQVSPSVLNLLQAVICDDSLFFKHGGKALAAGGLAAGVSLAWALRRKPTANPMSFHARIAKELAHLYPGSFEEFKPVASSGAFWAKLTHDPTSALVILGKDDDLKKLVHTEGSLACDSDPFAGIDCFFLVYEKAVDVGEKSPFVTFLTVLSETSFLFPREMQIGGCWNEDQVDTLRLQKNVAPAVLFASPVSLAAGLTEQIALDHGWVESEVCNFSATYKNKSAEFSWHCYGVNDLTQITEVYDDGCFSHIWIYILDSEPDINVDLTSRKCSRVDGFGSSVRQNIIIYRNGAHNLCVMSNKREREVFNYDELLAVVAEEIKSLMQLPGMVCSK